MSNATTLSEVYSAIQELLDLGEFVYATMHFDHNSNGNGQSPQGLPRDQQSMTDGTEIRNGSIYRTWQRRNIDAEQIRDSGRFWTLRLPLSAQKTVCGYLNFYRELGDEALLIDINYLCDPFQRETAKALERVLTAADRRESVPHLVVRSPATLGNELVLVPARADYSEAPALLRVAV